MIPWANFDSCSRNDEYDDIRIQLHETWLAWVEHGPSMTTLFLETPMLEVAHERQFVVSQQGTDSSGFVAEHMRRMEECLKQLEDHFHNFGTNDHCRPKTPCDFDVMLCWSPRLSLESLPPFTISDNPALDAISVSAQPHRRSSSPMTIPNMLNRSVSATSISKLQIDADDDDDDNDVELIQLAKLTTPRAGTKLPIHCARASRTVRQRKRHDSKFGAEPALVSRKRDSGWVSDEAKDDTNVAKRFQPLPQPNTSLDIGSENATSATHLPGPKT